MKHRRLSLVAGLATTLALVGGSLAPAVAAPRSAAPSPETYAALGDSFAAGWGAGVPVNGFGQTAEAYPVLLAGSPTNLTFTAFAFGATTLSTLTQVEDVPETAKQVTLTVGGNDLGFVPTVTECLSGPESCAAAVIAALSGLDDVGDSLEALIEAIHDKAPDAKIYVTGYPLLFQASGDYCLAGTFHGDPLVVPAEVTDQLDTATALLNATVKSRTKGKLASYTKYVDVTEAFDGHGVCGSDSWLNPVVVQGGMFDLVSLHPTTEGQMAYADQVMAKGFRSAVPVN